MDSRMNFINMDFAELAANAIEKMERENQLLEVSLAVNAQLILQRGELRREIDYLRMCLKDVLAYGNINPVCNGVKYEPGWLRNARDAAAGNIDRYPVVEK